MSTLPPPAGAARAALHSPTARQINRPPCPWPRPGYQLPFATQLYSPPYTRPTHLGMTRVLEGPDLAVGQVLVLDVREAPLHWARLEEAVRATRLRFPVTPVVLQLEPHLADVLQIAIRAARLPVRAVVFRGTLNGEVLRRHLTAPLDLAQEVVEWLALRGFRLSPVVSELVRQIVTAAPAHSEIGELCREVGAVESSARFRFHKKSLPAPSRWLQVARALHAVLRLQADPERPLLPLALELGFADHSALSHQVYRAFRVRPAAVRDLLGWEWLMDRWLRVSCAGYQPAATPCREV